MAEETSRRRRIKRSAPPSLAGTAPFSWWYLFPAVAAAAMGGSGRDALTAGVLLSTGLAIALDRSPMIRRPALQWTLLAFALWGLSAFFPAFFNFRPAPEWRRIVTGDLGIGLPFTVAPQPWLVLEQWLLLFAGCLFAIHLSARSFSSAARHKIAQCCVILAASLAGISIICYAFGWNVPGWYSAIGFGPFPNRNQSGNLFAIPIVVGAALAFDYFSALRLRAGFAWTAAALVLLAAAVLTTSRAALGIAFCAMVLWGGFMMTFSGMRATRVIVAFSVLLLCAGGVLAFGSKAIERILPHEAPQAAGPNLRTAMGRDILKMSLDTPVAGVGLGNFEAVFPFYRVASAAEERALHPDNDWVMTLAEMGWPGVVLALAAFVFFVRETLPFSRRTHRALRGAAAIAALSFAVHGLFDISGHRPGTVFPVLLLAACALHSGEFHSPMPPQVGRLLRGSGFALALFGAAFAGSAAGLWTLPGRDSAEELQQQAQEALKLGDTSTAIDLSTRALAMAPLRWQCYFQRAAAKVGERQQLEARADFRRARFLEPFHANVPLTEGLIWWEISPMASFAAWREAFYRNRRNPIDMLGPIFSLTKREPRWTEQLLALGQIRREVWIRCLDLLDEQQFQDSLDEQLEADPRLSFLTSAQRRQLFTIWENRLGLESLARAIQQQPTWKTEGWFWLARWHARNGSPEEAYAEALRQVSPAKIPLTVLAGTPESYEARWLVEQDNIDIPLALVQYYRENGRLEEALTVLTRVQALPNQAPPYFLYLKANTEGALKKWDDAWKSLELYVERTSAR